MRIRYDDRGGALWQRKVKSERKSAKKTRFVYRQWDPLLFNARHISSPRIF